MKRQQHRSSVSITRDQRLHQEALDRKRAEKKAARLEIELREKNEEHAIIEALHDRGCHDDELHTKAIEQLRTERIRLGARFHFEAEWPRIIAKLLKTALPAPRTEEHYREEHERRKASQKRELSLSESRSGLRGTNPQVLVPEMDEADKRHRQRLRQALYGRCLGRF